MASLLLEGDDLEQLLIRAQREGGPRARIVRAEKVRHGGVMGFFARESFEVALEIPDDGGSPEPGGSSPAAPDGAGPERSPVEALLDRLQDQLVDVSEVTMPPPPRDHAVSTDRDHAATLDALDDLAQHLSIRGTGTPSGTPSGIPGGPPAGTPADAPADRDLVPQKGTGRPEVEEQVLEGPGLEEPGLAEAGTAEAGTAEADTAEPGAREPGPRPRFAPFGQTFDAALQKFGSVVQQAQARQATSQDAPEDGATGHPVGPDPDPAIALDIHVDPAIDSDPHGDPDIAAVTGIEPVAGVPGAEVDVLDRPEGLPTRFAETLISPLDIRASASLATPASPVAPNAVIGSALAEPAPSGEILTVPWGAAVTAHPMPQASPPAAARARRRAADDGSPALSDMLDPVLAAERTAVRSVAGQPLSEPQDLVFHVPTRGYERAQAPQRDVDWERELALAAHTAAYAAVYATVHEDGLAAAQVSRARAQAAAGSPRINESGDAFREHFGDPLSPIPASRAATFALVEPRPWTARHVSVPALPPPASPAWHHHAAHSSEWGTSTASGHWAHLPTSAGMVIENPAGPGDPDRASRPEFTALLDQLRFAGETDPAADGRHSAPVDGAGAPLEALIPEPIAAEVAWTVVEGHGEEPAEDEDEDAQRTAPDAHETPTEPSAPAIDHDMVESIRRQAQAAIDEVYTAAGMYEEAMRTNRATATIPMPRRESLRLISDRARENAAQEASPAPAADWESLIERASDAVGTDPIDTDPIGTDLGEQPTLDLTHLIVPATDTPVELVTEVIPEYDRIFAPVPVPVPVHESGSGSVPMQARSGEGGRLRLDQARLRALGVPEEIIGRLRGGDRYADVWQALEQLPAPDIDPDLALVAVVGAPEVVLLEAHRVAVDLAVGEQPRPVVHVAAGRPLDLPAQVGRYPHCVIAIETDGSGDCSQVLEPLGRIAPGALIVVLDADLEPTEARRWLFELGEVDAIALDGVSTSAAPARLMQLGVPITRLDGIPIDRLTWTALLCAQLEAAHPAR